MDLGLRQIRVQILAGLHLPLVISGKLLPVTKLCFPSSAEKEQKSLPHGAILWIVSSGTYDTPSVLGCG